MHKNISTQNRASRVSSASDTVSLFFYDFRCYRWVAEEEEEQEIDVYSD